ncbi:MAG: arsenate reductase (azurin) small subunit [Planctomycetes bacterium]|nr:arsenate reductase (azurin) small subunit [Planctomycetota bacterium]
MMKPEERGKTRPCVSRREFLLAGGATVAAVGLSSCLGLPLDTVLQTREYPRKRIGRLSALKPDVPVEFKYPFEDAGSTSFLVKLGVPAAGGVGAEKDVVAFHCFCTHMGGLLSAVYRKEYKVAGPCPMHLSTFDLTRHGMIVAGHGTIGLPQVVLEVSGDEIFAGGIAGLVYGRARNV